MRLKSATKSIWRRKSLKTSNVYGASKAAMLLLAKTLSGELIERGIRVNAISLGSIAQFKITTLSLSVLGATTYSKLPPLSTLEQYSRVASLANSRQKSHSDYPLHGQPDD
jgi:NAD(P)-dependent dehydrogenase (short-subunit alcohol dehydrogenase family)